MPAKHIAIEKKLRSDGAPQTLINSFRRQFNLLAEGHTGLIPRKDLDAIGTLPDVDAISNHETDGRAALDRAVIIKLNGGLGTSMGLDKAKSLLPVKEGQRFLDIFAKQVLHIRRTTNAGLPLVLMNSFSTYHDTMQVLREYPELMKGQAGIPFAFLQHRVPRLLQESLEPVVWPSDPEKEWCPPGHGDLYIALLTSGLLHLLVKRGFEYAFVSNVDNLGATLDLRILGYFAEQAIPFLMEVTDRTEADKKGGHLGKLRGGGFILRELAQCPADEIEDFQDIEKHRFFNTNNLWINLKALHEHLKATNGIMELPLIVNRKTLDPRDPKSAAVVQLETAMGSALSVFPKAGALRVPRTRFSPVKTTDDLLALRSDAYELTPEMHLTISPRRKGAPPVIHLDPAHYRVLHDFDARFPDGAPSLLDCTSLTVEGDIRFGRGVVIKGSVQLRNSKDSQAIITAGQVISEPMNW